MKKVKKILLIDDDHTSVFITQRILKRAEIEADLLTASHGREALEIVQKVCEQEQCPELILLDINMPVMNGFEFLEELQKSENLKNTGIKIILLSSSRHYLDLARAREFPVIDCIEKPLTPEKLFRFL